ncbi:16S rRNA (cytosine(1402)-N(4))-methyltransferase [Bacillus canaveralius]|uniref:16S rRNA (Cytosine(1402)-N(4))-methyltransferase n=1 Tax=Bacillus canaveralius TaxID=1403243 RepID=A0A2N5GPC4_9BACI|nr:MULTISPECIES: class I SAM-dependent methyltransferase [Bacillus]PLR84423.1 16S rRNA (cytosine(1402)-N(4))-methyltransferase [Bacillus canaveralius]PLR86992.1 16S rRNA (cytosine(1402)-N(4))-methyltransferase [Bacillus sp. V33-4]PLS00575.1 16S rRNA (cytosine(1402)-N(4))-methyltransferase [Bacillus canaveralius]RSK57860.1 16S rRNA (cytosine(1402)-N(4))-methyltransferase [Bacillus canaveralius]
MKLERILPFAKTLLISAVQPGDIVVDATLGNGHDALFLANLVGPEGRVYGFDIQQNAILASKARLAEHDLLDRATLFHKGHQHIIDAIPAADHGRITGAIFNLGYLPGGDKEIVTRPETTIASVEQLLEIIAPEGIIVLVIYHGHQEGGVERDKLLQYLQELDQNIAHVLQYRFINQKNNPPFIIAIEKR